MEESLIRQLRTHKISYEQYRILAGLQKTAFIAKHQKDMEEAYDIYLGQHLAEERANDPNV